MAPVVRDAQTLSIEMLSSRMKDLTTQALGGTIAASDLCGATFTVSNLGSLGIESFTPVLNPPQAIILGVGRTTTWKFITEGTLKSVHMGGRRMIRAESLRKLIAEGTPSAKKRAA